MSETNNQNGILLRQTREAKGISLEMVHDATKIPMDVLKAIEDGYHVRTLSPFYYKGFLKLYAQFLGLDVAQVIDGYKSQELPTHIPKPVSEATQPDLLQERLKRVLSKKYRQQIIMVVGGLLAAFVIFKVMGFLISKVITKDPKAQVVKTRVQEPKKTKPPVKSLKELQSEKALKEAKAQAAKAAQSLPAATPKAAEVTAALDAAAPQSGAGTAAAGASQDLPSSTGKHSINLSVRAKRNTWLQVRVDGEVVFQSILKKGVAETWAANKEIELSGRNINQLEFELNGKMLGALGREERLAKKVIVTQNGLSVKK